MAFDFGGLGGLLSGVGNLGGFVGSLFGGNNNSQYLSNLGLANQSMQFAEDAAKNSVQWRVADARAAGISPLAALGISPASGPSLQVMGDSGGSRPDFGALSRAGQDLSRAAGATMTQAQRDAQAMDLAIKKAQLEKINSDTAYTTALTGSVVARMPGGPAMATAGNQNGIAGQGNTGLVKVEPSKVVAGNPNQPGSAAGGPDPYVRWMGNPDGSVQAEPPSGTAATFGGPPGLEHYIRNRVLPLFGGGTAPDISVMRAQPGHEQDTVVRYDYPSGGYRSYRSADDIPWYDRKLW